MNGFANSMLSLLLSWLKALIRDAWQLLSGEEGGALLSWLAAHWKGLVLMICLCGLVIDRVVYLIRWRPYYVWRSKRRARQERRRQRQQAQEQPVYEEPVYEEPLYQQPVEPQPVYEEPAYQPPVPESTRVYAPVEQTVDPVFDDEPIQWQPEEQFQQQPSFGTPKPEPIHELRDIQAGFAPPRPPEQLYTPRTETRADVHPGLDAEAIRHSFGLDQEEEPAQPLIHPLTWQPFPEQSQTKKAPGALSRIARKARDLVSMGDEDNAPTIHDLQPPVNRSQAFHKPVFPQAKHWQDGDEG